VRIYLHYTHFLKRRTGWAIEALTALLKDHPYLQEILEHMASVARTMLQEGAAIAFITKVTGLSAAEIEQLNLTQAD
jgi:phenylalanine-4-hydroxylase